MELELRDYLAILRKRKWVAAAALVLCIGAAALATALTTPVYRADAKLFVGQRQIALTDLTSGVAVTQLSLQLLKSYAEIIRSRPVAERAVDQDRLPVRPAGIVSEIRANPILDTQLIRLSYESVDPALAQRVVNAVSRAFVDEVEQIEGRRTPDAEPAVRVSVIESALQPSDPVRPQPVRNVALAGVLGLMLGVGLAFTVEYFDTTVKTPLDVAALTDAPLLATIPKANVEGRSVYLETNPQSAGAEAFRKLRTALQFLGADKPVQHILVTSPEASEGKSTVAVNLAMAFAHAGKRTVLVEADMRRPVMHTLFPVNGQRGLATTLVGGSKVEDTLMRTSSRNLRHIPAGAVPPNPAELLASGRMQALLSQLRQVADVVVIDSPPLLPVADASAIAPRVDGVILVTRAGKTHKDRLAHATQLISQVGGRLLGTVLNCQTEKSGKYGYYYYGGYVGASRNGATWESGRTEPVSGDPAPTTKT